MLASLSRHSMNSLAANLFNATRDATREAVLREIKPRFDAAANVLRTKHSFWQTPTQCFIVFDLKSFARVKQRAKRVNTLFL